MPAPLADGVVKDPHYIYKLYIALGNLPQAAKTAVIIARKEQEEGQYKAAHSVLFETFRDLEARAIRIPRDLIAMLTLLHSYLLVKKLVKVRLPCRRRHGVVPASPRPALALCRLTTTKRRPA